MKNAGSTNKYKVCQLVYKGREGMTNTTPGRSTCMAFIL